MVIRPRDLTAILVPSLLLDAARITPIAGVHLLLRSQAREACFDLATVIPQWLYAACKRLLIRPFGTEFLAFRAI
jgi:hypothetical protein